MDRRTVFDYIRKKYKMLPEYPWQKFDNNTVFRHPDNKKWFVLVMGVQRIKLCIAGDAYVDVVNLKIIGNKSILILLMFRQYLISGALN